MAARIKAGQVVSVDSAGKARLIEEAARCAKVLADAVLPAGSSVAIPLAPARGSCRAEIPREVEMTEAGPRERSDLSTGLRVRRLDAFDEMDRQARNAFPGVLRRWEAARRKAGLPVEGKGVHRPAFVAPFTVGQIEAGRDFAALVERVNGSGVKLSSVEGIGGGGQGGLRVPEAVSRDMARLAMLRRRVGAGIAKDVRRPSAGGKRGAIRVIDLVDRVCVGGLTVGQVAEAFGWGEDSALRAQLRRELAAALDRMRGFDLVRGVERG